MGIDLTGQDEPDPKQTSQFASGHIASERAVTEILHVPGYNFARLAVPLEQHGWLDKHRHRRGAQHR